MHQTGFSPSHDHSYAGPAMPWTVLMPWAVFAVILSMLFLYFAGAEQGATSLISGHGVHEFVHDGRHLLGFPCH